MLKFFRSPVVPGALSEKDEADFCNFLPRQIWKPTFLVLFIPNRRFVKKNLLIIISFLFLLVFWSTRQKQRIPHFFQYHFFRFLSIFRCKSSYYEEKILRFYLEVTYFI
jgi:hypothetical protein